MRNLERADSIETKRALEKALASIEDSEPVEVTPSSIRLRKKPLDETDRKREERAQKAKRFRSFYAHDLFRIPVPIPDRVEDILFGIMRRSNRPIRIATDRITWRRSTVMTVPAWYIGERRHAPGGIHGRAFPCEATGFFDACGQ